MKLIGFAQLRNEYENGNLNSWLDQQTKLCDKVYIYDQCSTDGSFDIYNKYSNLEIIYSKQNDFRNEIICKQKLLSYLQQREGFDNIIFWVDGDTFVDTTFEKERIINIFKCTEATHIKLRHYNLWRSDTFYRIDGKFHNLFLNGVCSIWKNSKDLSFNQQSGLHNQQYPNRLNTKNIHITIETSLIHRGFSTDFQIIKRYNTYKNLGQSGYSLERLLDESTLDVRQLNLNLIPKYIPDNTDSPVGKEFIRDIYNRKF